MFHHVQGLTQGVVAFADRLRAAGHTVHTPDLFDGRTFPTLEEGMAYAKTAGFDAILDQGVQEAEVLGADLVYAGFSLGVMPAQKLAQTRAGARGALLIDACFPVSEFGDRWPEGVPFQVHGMDATRISPKAVILMRRRPWSTLPRRANSSSIPATSTCLRTRHCPRTTSRRRSS